MKPLSQKDLMLVAILSLFGLTLLWLPSLKNYPYNLIPSLLILFVPGYAIMMAIKPRRDSMAFSVRIIIGLFLGFLFLFLLPPLLKIAKMDYLTSFMPVILFILSIFLSLVTIIRRRNLPRTGKDGLETQLTLEEAIERAAEMREKATEDELTLEHFGGEKEEKKFKEEYFDEEEFGEEDFEEEYSDEEEFGKEDFEEEYSDEEEFGKEDFEEEYSDEEDFEEEYFEEEESDKKIIGKKTVIDSDLKEIRDPEPVLDESSSEKDHQDIEDDKSIRRSYLELNKSIKKQRIPESASKKHLTTEFEEEMGRPVWLDDLPGKKSKFQQWDLILILVLTGVFSLYIYFDPLKESILTSISFLALLFITGYAILSPIYPDKRRLDNITRFLICIFLGLLIFIPTFIAWKMQLEPSKFVFVILFTSLATLLLVLVTYWRRRRASSYFDETEYDEYEDHEGDHEYPDEHWEEHEEEHEEEYEGYPTENAKDGEESEQKEHEDIKELKPFETDLDVKKDKKAVSTSDEVKDSFWRRSLLEKTLSIILIISIILAISTTAYIIIKPKQGEKFTEFYILGPDGKASNYPTNLTSGQNGTVIIGMVNHEYAPVNYTLIVNVNGNNTLKNERITLQDGQKVEIPFSFTAGQPGEKKMEFLLYKEPDLQNPYRSLHLWLNVTK